MKLTRILALLLCLVLAAGLFAGCTQSEPAATNTPAANSGTANSGASSSGSANSGSSTPAPADGGQDATEPSVGLPLAENLTNIEIWQPWAITGFSSFLEDWNSCLGYQLLERDTNIHVLWNIPASGTENEDFQLLIASQMYPDVISNFTMYYTQGLIHAVDNDIAIVLDDYVDRFMPNYTAWLQRPGTKLKVTTDDGFMAAIYCIDDMPQSPWIGNAVRQDWLDRVGMTAPTTYDEIYDVLVAFRDNIEECESPMLLDGANIGGDNLFYSMCAGFGVIGDFFARDGKTVMYGPSTPEYLDYLRLMRSWYAEGLIDKDFTTRGAFSDAISYLFNNKAGYANSFRIGTADEQNGQASDPNYHMVPVPNPTKNKNDPHHFGTNQDDVEAGAVITTQCSDPELIARWYDYQYGETGAMYLNYGEEGNTFFYDENGEPCLSSAGMEAFYGVPIGTCIQANGPISQAHLRYFFRGRPTKNADQGLNWSYINAGEVWSVDVDEWNIPSFVTMTSEESTAYNAIYNDLNTYVDEVSVKFIMGAMGEEDLVTMQSTIQSMGVDRCIAIRQAALDRYLAR